MAKNYEAIKSEYENLTKKIIDYDSRIKQLLKIDELKEYATLMSENTKLQQDLENILKELKKQKMLECEHVFIIGDIIHEEDCCRVDKVATHYCIKCGLDTTYAINNIPHSYLSKIQSSMYEIYRQTAKNGTIIETICSPILAQKIYEGIKKQNPNISDEDLIKYFNAALHNIEKNNHEKHFKHLGLIKHHNTYISSKI